MMGIKSKLNGYCAETLGGLEDGVSPLEMANAYATIANGGYRNRPRAITQGRSSRTASHELPARWRVQRTKAFEDGVTYEATKILEQNIHGRHRHARPQIGCPAGRQDRHDRQEHRRLVRRLHAAAVDRRVGRLSRPSRVSMNGALLGAQRRRRHVPGRDLGRVHEAGRRQVLRRLQAAQDAVPGQPFFGHYARAGGKAAAGRRLRRDPSAPSRTGGTSRPTPATRHAATPDNGDDNGDATGDDGTGGCRPRATVPTVSRPQPCGTGQADSRACWSEEC